jgi:hypothetical protein
MSHSQRYKVAIPNGYKIFFSEMEVAGLNYRMDDFIKLCRSKKAEIDMVPEPRNTHDKNAIKVIAIIKGIFWDKKLHLGYVPRDVAKRIADTGVIDIIKIRLKEIWLGDRGGAKVVFDLVGPKNQYDKISNA